MYQSRVAMPLEKLVPLLRLQKRCVAMTAFPQVEHASR
ncbi:hypothetical protein ACVWYY_002642 [Thermostichus sp. MS-CIW-34]